MWDKFDYHIARYPCHLTDIPSKYGRGEKGNENIFPPFKYWFGHCYKSISRQDIFINIFFWILVLVVRQSCVECELIFLGEYFPFLAGETGDQSLVRWNMRWKRWPSGYPGIPQGWASSNMARNIQHKVDHAKAVEFFLKSAFSYMCCICCGHFLWRKLQWCGEMSEWTQKLFILLENKLLLNIGGNIVHFDKRIINFIWRTVEPQILSVWMKYIRAVMRLVNVMISVSFVIVKVHNWGIEIVAAGHRLTQGWLCAPATYDGHTRVMTWSTWVGGI